LRKLTIAAVSIVIFLAVLIPFASSNPDGLEKVALTLGAKEHQNFWNGWITDYSFSWISNQYVSTLLAGVFGVIIVLAAGLLLGKTMGPKTLKQQES